MMPARFALLAAVLPLVCGCSQARIVLLEGDAPSAITVSNDTGVVRLDQPGEAVRIENRKSTPQTVQLSAADIKEEWGDALALHPPKPKVWRLYFDFDSAELKRDSWHELPALIAAIKARTAGEVTIIGYTDRSGPEAYNDGLGLRRAEMVRRQFVTAGIPVWMITVESYGPRDPFVASSRPFEPLNRRAEITLR